MQVLHLLKLRLAGGTRSTTCLFVIFNNKFKFVKKNFAKLFWRVYIKFSACVFVYFFFQISEFFVIIVRQFFQIIKINFYASFFHFFNYGNKRKFNIVINFFKFALFYLRQYLFFCVFKCFGVREL